MNIEKLVDAVGLIDDELIMKAKYGKPQTSFYKKSIAAVLIIALIPVMLFGGMMIFGMSLRASAPDPRYQYSFSKDEMKALCYTNFKTTDNPSVTMNPETINGTIGAIPIEIHYADETRVIFSTYNGIFEHIRTTSNYIDSSYNTEKIGIPGINYQGDKTTSIRVSENGAYAILSSYKNSCTDVSYHKIEFNNDSIIEVDEYDLTDPFPLSKNKYTQNNDVYFKKDAFMSTNMATYIDENGDTVDCFIKVPKVKDKGYIIGNAQLVEIHKNGEINTCRLFGYYIGG